MVGVAAAIRDSNGDFMVCRMHNCHGLIEAREAETKAFLDALTWTVSLDLKHLIFETYSKSVVDVFFSNLMDDREFQLIIVECCSLFFIRTYLQSLVHQRQTNEVAHTLEE